MLPISNLCKNVAPLSLALGASSWALRRFFPLPVSVVLMHTAVAGLAVSLAANDAVVQYTHNMLGKASKREQGQGGWASDHRCTRAWELSAEVNLHAAANEGDARPPPPRQAKESGQVHPLGYAVFWPYHATLRARIWIKRGRTQEPLWNEVLPGWYIGGWPFAEGQLPGGGQDPLAQLDATAELPARVKEGAPYHNVPIYDTMGPSVEQTDAAARWAAQQRQAGAPVYVFCQNGHGRSGVLMCAALMAAGAAPTWQAALEMVQAKRPKVRLNAAQQASLEAWAERHAKSS